jgi:CRISPR-associated endoribonuclease Cas6
MLAELKMELDVEKQEIGYYQSSNMQGVLMEHIDSEYAEKLHHQTWNPYSLCITAVEDKVIWSVRTLNEEAYENIIKPLACDDFIQFFLAKKGKNIGIRKKELAIKQKKELLEEFYSKPAEKYLNIEFLTPAAFKSEGRYVIIPNERYIYQSLMNKYSASSENDFEMFDSETLESLSGSSEISGYRLKSTFFPLQGVKIPAFKGELTLKMRGTDTMARYARFLLKFGEYSGVGIKSSMGMGSIRYK